MNLVYIKFIYIYMYKKYKYIYKEKSLNKIHIKSKYEMNN